MEMEMEMRIKMSAEAEKDHLHHSIRSFYFAADTLIVGCSDNVMRAGRSKLQELAIEAV